MDDNGVALGYESLEQIVYTFLDMADRGEESYRKAYNLGIKGYREMMMDVAGPVSFAIINVLANKTGRLPDDYSNKVRVGIPNSVGELAAFRNNEELSLFNVKNVDRLGNPGINTYDGGSIVNAQNIPRDVYFPYFDYQTLGVGSVNDIGAYKIDKLSGYIVFDPDFSYTKVVMEYVADSNKFNGDYMIDINASQAVLDYIIWRWNWLRKDVPLSEKITQRREFYNQKRLARQRMNPLTLNDINDSARRNTMLAPHA